MVIAATAPGKTTEQSLRDAVCHLPRARLGYFPTPLEECARFSEALGGPRILVKRDDLTGLAFGGNKTRKLEFNLGEAVARGADVMVGGAAAQSNHCRQAAAAAAKFGLECHLFLQGGQKDAYPPQGNLLLDHLLGAQVHLLQGEEGERVPEIMAAHVEALRAQGRRPYQFMGTPEADRLGALSYVDTFLELQTQLREQGLRADRLYVASGGGTGGGLTLAAKIVAPETKVVTFTPIDTVASRRQRMCAQANAAAELLGLPERLTEAEITMHDEYIGPSYGIATPAGIEATTLLARTEGIILEPIYTAKAVAGLIDHVRRGLIGKDETVVYLHTGGLPALFAYNEEFAVEMSVDVGTGR
ncbi:MAG TPA: D-cysteine desulfhydrase family protein [Chloroflexota bacterium]|nr:D-cysteine desulfhydrase family protein [Chloroflexota bacterium]